MADVKWIKIVTDIFDDEKILLIESLPEADSIIVIWFKLLCLAGKQNNSGVFTMNGNIPYTDTMLSTIFRRKETTVQLALQTFEKFGMIEIVENTITIPNWGKHQNLDRIEAKTEYMRNYMQEYRQKQKQLVDGKPYCKANSKANVSQADKDIEVDIELDKDIDTTPKAPKGAANTPKSEKRFIPPTIEEITAYCTERGKGVDPEKWLNHYQANGWMVGKTKMKSWEAAVRTWEKGRNSNPSQNTTGNIFADMLREKQDERN